MSAVAIRALRLLELGPTLPAEDLDEAAALALGERRLSELRAAVAAIKVHSLTAYCVMLDSGVSVGERNDQIRHQLELWELAVAAPEDRPPLPVELWWLARRDVGETWRNLRPDAQDVIYLWWAKAPTAVGKLVRWAVGVSGGSLELQEAALAELRTYTLTVAETSTLTRWGARP